MYFRASGRNLLVLIKKECRSDYMYCAESGCINLCTRIKGLFGLFGQFPTRDFIQSCFPLAEEYQTSETFIQF